MKRSFQILQWVGGLSVLAICVVAASLMAGAAVGKMAKQSPLPPPAVYTIDPVHSFVTFRAWHHIVGRIGGRFDRVSGVIISKENPAESSVDITIDPASINTHETRRDADLKGPDFFDVAKYPEVRYKG